MEEGVLILEEELKEDVVELFRERNESRRGVFVLSSVFSGRERRRREKKEKQKNAKRLIR